MSATLQNVQGAAIHGGYVYLSTSDLANDIYRVSIATGQVQPLGSAGHPGGEGEGIDATPLPSGAIHVMTRVGKDGAIGKACAETDDTADPALRTCALSAVRATKLDAPARPGIVPFGTALLFYGKPVTPICD